MHDAYQADNEYQDQALVLLHELDTIPTPDLYDQQLVQLRHSDHTALVIGLGQLLAHPNADIRSRAGEVLLILDAANNLDQVVPLLKDSDAHVRFVLTYWFCSYGDDRAVDALMDIVLHDSDSTTRSYAAIALGNIGALRALPVLRHVARHDDGVDYEGEPVRSSANQAIEQIMKRTTPLLDGDCR